MRTLLIAVAAIIGLSCSAAWFLWGISWLSRRLKPKGPEKKDLWGKEGAVTTARLVSHRSTPRLGADWNNRPLERNYTIVYEYQVNGRAYPLALEYGYHVTPGSAEAPWETTVWYDPRNPSDSICDLMSEMHQNPGGPGCFVTAIGILLFPIITGVLLALFGVMR